MKKMYSIIPLLGFILLFSISANMILYFTKEVSNYSYVLTVPQGNISAIEDGRLNVSIIFLILAIILSITSGIGIYFTIKKLIGIWAQK